MKGLPRIAAVGTYGRSSIRLSWILSLLRAIQGPLVIGGGSLAAAGRKLLGSYEPELDDFSVDRIVMDDEGKPVEAYYEDLRKLDDEDERYDDTVNG